MGRPFINIAGKRFGRLVPQCFLGTADGVGFWICLCDCGNQCVVASGDLKKTPKQSTKSCGCWRRESCRKTGREQCSNLKHGYTIGNTETPVYTLWCSAKRRAAGAGLAFTLRLDDIVIPECCPVFGTRLIAHRGGRGYWHDDSPTLDRIIPSLGYTPDNVWVISYRANRIKSDASLEELKRIINAMKLRLNHAQV